jgi:alpha/beta superfamily hydrolase
MLLPSNITVFAYDFSGSGLSEGEYVSLGYYEKEDLKAVVEYLRLEGKTSKIGLWGRSMGAHTWSVPGIALDHLLARPPASEPTIWMGLHLLCLLFVNSCYEED